MIRNRRAKDQNCASGGGDGGSDGGGKLGGGWLGGGDGDEAAAAAWAAATATAAPAAATAAATVAATAAEARAAATAAAATAAATAAGGGGGEAKILSATPSHPFVSQLSLVYCPHQRKCASCRRGTTAAAVVVVQAAVTQAVVMATCTVLGSIRCNSSYSVLQSVSNLPVFALRAYGGRDDQRHSTPNLIVPAAELREACATLSLQEGVALPVRNFAS